MHGDSSSSRGLSYMNTGSYNKNIFGDPKWVSEPEEVQIIRDPCPSGKVVRDDTDMALDDGVVCKN